MMRALILAFAFAAFFTQLSAASAPPAVKMSTSGICHTTSSAWYGRTKNFTPYNTLSDCVARGGRPPKGQSGSTPVSQASSTWNGREAYDRDRHFGSWIDADGDCFNTRHELLSDLSTGPVLKSGCRVIQGRWLDPYTGRVFTQSKDVDIDHMVPLKWAWDHGADTWSKDQRVRFANDPINLFVVDAPTNRQKSASGPLQWLPPNASYHCEYVLRFKRIVLTYKMTLSQPERSGFDKLQSQVCG